MIPAPEVIRLAKSADSAPIYSYARIALGTVCATLDHTPHKAPATKVGTPLPCMTTLLSSVRGVDRATVVVA